jgi:hypothetical protein
MNTQRLTPMAKMVLTTAIARASIGPNIGQEIITAILTTLTEIDRVLVVAKPKERNE